MKQALQYGVNWRDPAFADEVPVGFVNRETAELAIENWPARDGVLIVREVFYGDWEEVPTC